MDLEHALEIAEESKTGGYDSITELALQFLADYVGESARRCSMEYEGKLAITIQSIVGLKASLREAEQKALEAGRKAREDCAEICDDLSGDNFHDPYDCANAIRATIQDEPT